MPAYQTTPFKPVPQLAVVGTPNYVFGSFDDRTGPTYGRVLTDAGVTTTATVVFQILSGNIPAVGSKITVRGTSNGAGNFNVTNATILTVSTTNAGVCTVTYAISSTSQGTTADGGEVMVPQPEVAETLVSGASVPVASPYNNSQTNSEKTISVNVKFPSAPSTGVVMLQGANFDIDAEYQDLVTVYNSSTNTTGEAEIESNYRFYRLNVSGASGGSSPTVIGKLEF